MIIDGGNSCPIVVYELNLQIEGEGLLVEFAA